jgi:hypothetical protein
MKVDEQFLNNEIKNAEAVVGNQRRQLIAAEGGLDVLRQIRKYLDKPEPEPAEPKD